MSPRYRSANASSVGGRSPPYHREQSPEMRSNNVFTFDPENYTMEFEGKGNNDPFGNRKAHFQEDRAVWKYKWNLKDVELMTDAEVAEILDSEMLKNNKNVDRERMVGVKMSRVGIASSSGKSNTDRLLIQE